MAGMAKKLDQDPDVEDVANDTSANDRTLADPLYTHSADRPPPRAHPGEGGGAARQLQFPAGVRPRRRRPTTAGQPMGVGHVEEGTKRKTRR